VVYHAAAVLGARNEAALMVANRDGTANIARACIAEKKPPRMVLISSMAAGGPAQRGVPKLSNDDDQPVTMYGRSKLASEQVLAPMEFPWVVLRPPVVYGPGDREAMLPMFRAVRFGIAPTFGDGSMEISLVTVADLVDAIVLAGTADSVIGRTFYVNHPEVVTGIELMRRIALQMNRSPWPLRIPRWAARSALSITGAWAGITRRASVLHPDKIHEFYQEAWTADPREFIHATGWTPHAPLDRGLTETAAWYREQGWI
jgi:dihydroflavonol-4-reductase